MVNFCTCGSLIIDNACTNKNCPSKPASNLTKTKSAKAKGTSTKAASPAKKSRASKCITYNLNDLNRKEEEL